MFIKKFIGWAALVLFVVAVVILTILVLLVLSPSLANLVTLNLQALLVVSGVFTLMATSFGLYAFKTAPGKVGAVGGQVLFIAIAILLSYTTITTRIERHSAQPTSPVGNGAPVTESIATEMIAKPKGKLSMPSFESQIYMNETVGFALDYTARWLAQETLVGERGTQVIFVSSPELAEAASKIEILEPLHE